MNYNNTRGGASLTAGQAILKGLADNGGLYVPEAFPALHTDWAQWASLPYSELAFEILRLYLTDYNDNDLRTFTEKAYSPLNFTAPLTAPLHKTDEIPNAYFLELFHGRTLAFKDMALSLLPYLLTAAAKKYRPGVQTVILTATSGDTGKAALEAFADIDGVSISVFFPEDGVSPMQKRQMVTQEGGNVHVFGVHGNFDDAQTGVKQIFNDQDLVSRMTEAGLAFSSANSINIGRLLPQVVYYIYAYGQLVRQNVIKPGETIDFTVPTGNFGNILAGYYAAQMGLPVRKLICASNRNNVLHDFFTTGEYDLNRDFHTTISPSMDILLSSNLERLLYHASGNDPEHVQNLMDALKSQGKYQFNHATPLFESAFATEEETRAAMRDTAEKGYVTDPHTAVAYHAFRQSGGTEGNIPNVIISTASPYKFAADVLSAILPAGSAAPDTADADCLLEKLARVSGTPAPDALKTLSGKKVLHTQVCEIDKMKETLIKNTGINLM